MLNDSFVSSLRISRHTPAGLLLSTMLLACACSGLRPNYAEAAEILHRTN